MAAEYRFEKRPSKGNIIMKKYLILFAAICVLLFAAGCTEQTNVSEGESAGASSAGESSWGGESLTGSSEGEDSPGESSYIVEISIPWSEDESSQIDPSEDESDPEDSSVEEPSQPESSEANSSEPDFSGIYRDESEPKLEDIVISPIEEKEFSFKQTELLVLIGSKVEVPFEFVPVGTTNKKLTWQSSDHQVIRVEEDGSLTAVALGEATVTATTSKGNKATCLVKVVEEIPMSPLASLIYKKTEGSFTGWTFALQDVDGDGVAELLARTHGEDGLPVNYVIRISDGEELYSFVTGVDEEWAAWKRKDGSAFILVSYTQNLKNGDTAYGMDELTLTAGKPAVSPVLYRKASGEYNARIDGTLVKCDKAAYNAVRTAYFAENTQTKELELRWMGGMDAETIATALQRED